MDAEERPRIEAATVKISAEKKAVEADPGAAMKASRDALVAMAKRGLLFILFWVLLAAVAIGFYVRGRS